jgi:hypothetical protein
MQARARLLTGHEKRKWTSSVVITEPLIYRHVAMLENVVGALRNACNQHNGSHSTPDPTPILSYPMYIYICVMRNPHNAFAPTPDTNFHSVPHSGEHCFRLQRTLKHGTG